MVFLVSEWDSGGGGIVCQEGVRLAGCERGERHGSRVPLCTCRDLRVMERKERAREAIDNRFRALRAR